MERRTCKLCFKSFSNGRALGGHMRSHMATLQPSNPPPPPPQTPSPPPKIQQLINHHHHQQQQKQIGDETESASSSSPSSSSEEEQELEEEEGLDKGGLLSYGLRENPKKSFRLVDPEFQFAVVDAGSSVIQDRESETESSKNPSIRRRSKRVRKSGITTGFTEHHHHHHHHDHHQPELKKPKKLLSKLISKSITELHQIEPSEPVSSVSDTSPEEDVALCLMMLSRGSWDCKEEEQYEEEEDKSIEGDEEMDDEEEEEEEDDESREMRMMDKMKLSTPPKRTRNRNRPKYQCGTCKKVFKSYQALGGHRASHKKIRGCNQYITPSSSSRTIIHGDEFEEPKPGRESNNNNNNGNAGGVGVSSGNADKKIHECPVCFRVFGSGQALGGHKRSHPSAGSSPATIINNNNNNNNNTNRFTTSNSAKFGDNLIDLNLPAPVDDDDISQIELSAVSDAEFVDTIK